MTISRSDDEKTALHLHRYKGWADTVAKINNDMVQMHAQMQQMAENMSNALLEAREELESLIAMGMTQKEIEAIAKLSHITLDPLVLLRRARAEGAKTP